ncbi:MAG: GNAT family N-acetyltransferase [Actinomycetota bacterium]|nr:GNAT family N-acetyltransferase [Actinomycetota bacterium]
MDELGRARAFLRALPLELAEETRPSRFGVAAFVHSLPRVYWLNLLSVEPGTRTTADELAAEADRVQAPAGLTHRKLSVYDELGYDVEDAFRGMGWRVERHVVMTHERPADLASGPVEEIGFDELEHVWAAGIRSEPWGRDEDVVRQLVAAQHRRRVGAEVRYLAARAEGEIASYCELLSDGETAQVESVMTLERFRGRGLAKAVVSHAVREARAAGNSLVFLVADDADWPKELYARLGFEARGHSWELTREPPPPA